jgi:hypothetical protein
VIENSRSLKAPRSSVTRTVKLNVPAVVGVPEMVFSRLGSSRPGGRAPRRPPTRHRAGPHRWRQVAAAVELAGGRISIVKVSVSVARVSSLTWTVKVKLPAVVGTPLIAYAPDLNPVEGLWSSLKTVGAAACCQGKFSETGQRRNNGGGDRLDLKRSRASLARVLVDLRLIERRCLNRPTSAPLWTTPCRVPGWVRWRDGGI